MYTYDKKILFSDIDASSSMSIKSILNVMQDVVNINSESIGKGIEYMHETKRAWFAVSWNIEIKRFPKMFENVVAKTWPYSFAASLGMRNVIITDEDGNDILCADSVWSLVDTENMVPVKITEEDCAGYEIEEKYPMESLGRKIKLPKESKDNFAVIGEHIVTKNDLDFNGHMTNARYIEYADDFYDLDKNISRVRVEYKTQSKLGEKLTIERYFDENTFFIRFKGENDDVKAIVEFA